MSLAVRLGHEFPAAANMAAMKRSDAKMGIRMIWNGCETLGLRKGRERGGVLRRLPLVVKRSSQWGQTCLAVCRILLLDALRTALLVTVALIILGLLLESGGRSRRCTSFDEWLGPAV
jgi:hypothetical protein